MLVATTVLATAHGTRSRSATAIPGEGRVVSRFRQAEKATKQALLDFSEGKSTYSSRSTRIHVSGCDPDGARDRDRREEDSELGVAPRRSCLRQLSLRSTLLALSADTPIPRTLPTMFACAGPCRDISVIETPPRAEADRTLRRESTTRSSSRQALKSERGAARRGRRSYLHNRVETIRGCGGEASASAHEPAIPGRARTDGPKRPARGQDDRRFLAGDADVLVVEPIIE